MLTSTVNRVSYPGANLAGPFVVPFRLQDAEDLVVMVETVTGVVVTLEENLDYTVTSVGSPQASVTLDVVLAVGETLTMLRRPPHTQPLSIRNQGQYFPDLLEDQFDRLVMQVQALQDDIDLRIGLASNLTPADFDLTVVPETGKVLAWVSETELGNVTLDAGAIAIPGGGRTVPTLSAYLLNNAVLNVKDFGAVGDGVTDDWAAFTACEAAAGIMGARIYIPPTANGYYLSKTWRIYKPSVIIGVAETVGANVGNTILSFAADQTGIQFEGNSTLGDTKLGAPRAYSADGAQVHGVNIVSRGGKTGLANGGSGVNCDGFRLRAAYVKLFNCSAKGFKRNGIRIRASEASGGDDTLYGNAGVWRADNCTWDGNGEDGMHVSGLDTSVGVAKQCNAVNNTGRGFLDSCFLGCKWDSCHAAGNGGRPFEHTGAVSPSIFDTCYVESSGVVAEPLQAKILKPAIVVGGMLSQLNVLAPTSTATCYSANGIVRGALPWRSDLGPVAVGSSLGFDSAGMQVFAWGSADVAATYDEYRLTYLNAAKRWSFRYANNPSFDPISLPTNIGGFQPRAFAPIFNNGIIVGGAADGGYMDAGCLMDAADAAPATTARNRGDFRRNINLGSALDSGRPFGWLTLTAGTPGTQRPYGIIPGMSGDRGDVSFTLTSLVDAPSQRMATNLTVNRIITLSATNTYNGAYFHITRTGLGAFTVDVGGLKTLPAGVASWCTVEHDGIAWRLRAYGLL